jgi:iron complex transport system substrate-binding protein
MSRDRIVHVSSITMTSHLKVTSRRSLLARSLASLGTAAALGSNLPGSAAHGALPAPASLTPGQLARIVSIGGSVTEIVYALGFGDRIVAVDTTSLYPAKAMQEKRSVGYMRALSAEGVLSVNPSSILLLEGSGPPQTVEFLTRSPVPCIVIDGIPSPDAVAGRVRFLATLLGVPEIGEAISDRIEAGFSRLVGLRLREAAHQRVLFVLSMQNGRPMAAGRDTAANAILGLAGAINVADGFEGYKPLSDEAVITLAPDVVLTMTKVGPSGTAGLLDTPAFRATPAGRHHRMVSMDGESLLGFGPRTPEVALELMHLLAAAGS